MRGERQMNRDSPEKRMVDDYEIIFAVHMLLML